MTAVKKPVKYRAVVGVEIGGVRFETGETLTVEPPVWMVEGGKVEQVKKKVVG
jgi:hypothetical protein